MQIALGDIGKEPRPKEMVQIMADMETKHGGLNLLTAIHPQLNYHFINVLTLFCDNRFQRVPYLRWRA